MIKRQVMKEANELTMCPICGSENLTKAAKELEVLVCRGCGARYTTFEDEFKNLHGANMNKCKRCGDKINLTISGSPIDICWGCLQELEKEEVLNTLQESKYALIDGANLTDLRQQAEKVFKLIKNWNELFPENADEHIIVALMAVISDASNQRFQKVNRVEVIDEKGRSYVNYLHSYNKVTIQMQDDDRTLKVFITNKNQAQSEPWR